MFAEGGDNREGLAASQIATTEGLKATQGGVSDGQSTEGTPTRPLYTMNT